MMGCLVGGGSGPMKGEGIRLEKESARLRRKGAERAGQKEDERASQSCVIRALR